MWPVRTTRGLCQKALFSSLILSAPLAVQAAQADTLRIEWIDQSVTITARDVPLAAVLSDLARQTGSIVKGLEGASDPITVDIEGATLTGALRTLLSGRNYIYIQHYSEQAKSYDRVTLWLYGPSTGTSTTTGCPQARLGCASDAKGEVPFEAPPV